MPKVVADNVTQISTLLSVSLYDELKESARRNGRTMRGELEIALKAHLERQDEPQLPDELIKAIEDYLERQGYRQPRKR